MAMARPPSVMVFTVRPSAWKTTTVTSTETGIAVSDIRVARTFIRNRTSTPATTAAASSSTRLTLPMEVSMKVA